MKFRIFAALIAVALAGFTMAGLAAKSAKPEKPGKVITMSDGLKYQDVIVGKGATPKPGQTVTVGYVGTLVTGKQFDANSNFTFNIGEGRVIRGWDEGVMSMKIGGTRKLIIPPDLAYGPNGFPPVIPPNSTLLFTIQLIDVE